MNDKKKVVRKNLTKRDEVLVESMRIEGILLVLVDAMKRQDLIHTPPVLDEDRGLFYLNTQESYEATHYE